MQTAESDILTQIKAGDTGSFEQVYHAHCKALVRYANTILKNQDEAEDIVQQLFVGLWTKRDSLEVNTSLKSYLYKAVHNSSLNRIKQLQIKEGHNNQIEYVTEKYALSPNAVLDGKEVQEAIDTAIGELPDQCRIIFTMSRYQGLKYQQIADQMNLSVKTVENQMGKALKYLRTRLHDYLPSVIVMLLFGN